MASLLGTSNKGATPAAVNLQRMMESSAGVVIPLVYGTQRLAPNFIWVGDIQVQSPNSGKKFSPSGKGAAASYTYTMSVALGISEGGPVITLLRAWGLSNVADVAQTPLQAQRTWFLHNGDPFQGTWSHLIGEGYPGIAFRNTVYISRVNWNLGNSPQPPQVSFEIMGLAALTQSLNQPGYLDTQLSSVFVDLFTNQIYGLGMNENLIGTNRYKSPPQAGFFFDSLVELGAWVTGASLYISPLFDNPRSTAEWIQELLDIVNCEMVFQNEALYVVPYADQAVSSNPGNIVFPAVTFTPFLTPLRTFGDNDYVAKKNQPPVKITRKMPTDRYNETRVTYRSRYKNYDNVVEVAKLQTSIDLFNVRPYQDFNYPHITNPDVASKVARMRLHRLNFAVQTYDFTVAPVHIDLDPMDIIAINDPSLPSNYAVRIKTIKEDKDGNLAFTCEDIFPGTWMGNAVSQGFVTETGINGATVPGNVNPPIFFEPKSNITNHFLQIWIALSGNPRGVWGGCHAWLSIDGGTTYNQIGSIVGANSQGVLLATLPSASGLDTTNTLKVDENTSGGQLTSISHALAALYQNLAYIDNGAGTGEFLSFATVNALPNGEFDETYLERGLYGSSGASHSTGAAFAFVGSVANIAPGIFIYTVPTSPNLIGTVLHFKFTSFNVWGQAEQDLSAVTDYTYTFTGNGA